MKQRNLQHATNNVSASSWTDIHKLEVDLDLDFLLEVDERYWKQRSHETWLKDGDKNSKYFHSHASARKSCNRIEGVFDNLNVWKDDLGEICAIVEDYFEGIFRSNNPSQQDMEIIFACVKPCIFENN